jgi:hypothetical protein
MPVRRRIRGGVRVVGRIWQIVFDHRFASDQAFGGDLTAQTEGGRARRTAASDPIVCDRATFLEGAGGLAE